MQAVRGLPLRNVIHCVASTSRRPAQLHTSAVRLAGHKQASVIRKQNILKQAQRSSDALKNRPSVVLGTRPSEESTKWPKCKLAKILVDEEALASGKFISSVELPVGRVAMSSQLAFGVAKADKKLLFEQLPAMTVEAVAGRYQDNAMATPLASMMRPEIAAEHEARKAAAFAKVIDLRNTNAAGIAFENRRRIVIAFSTPDNPYDTGRAEVQAALKTYEIRNLWTHLTTFKRDVGNRLGLRKLVHQRAKILKYLRNTNRDRYETVLEQLALEPEAVEGELVV
ncbi:S15/NS1 RNA-binding domain-containing protein [Coprinopsis marcescibilis]|uniref:S15/NS1 RNA-binding domain-containing protein n=1 Tax=Coprinopsis marcescibilis TaxID=230819 RepID=A0A5C3KQA0_COPMA|nr:S15/NS1 RNA-binding domain-containing protein [Coprinopsis marcescibilis]